jgi:glycosyltransferase involved in cell wall biosynthesis
MSGGTSVLVVFGRTASTPAGAERMAWRTAGELAHRGDTVVLLTDSTPPRSMAGRTVRSVPELAQRWPGWRPDLVHAFDLAEPEYAGAARRLAAEYRVPLALTPCSDPQVWPDRAAGRAACRAAQVLFAVTPHELAGLRELGVPASRIRRVPPAPDLTGTPDPERFRRAYRIGAPAVLYLGRRASFKGYRELLAAGPLVWRQLPETRFVFAGPDSEPEAAEWFRAYADPRVHDLGAVDEQTKHDALAACDLLALPTRADVFPLVFIEAWSCGRPVVSGDYPGVCGTVRHGVDGLVTGTRPEQLAEALVGLLRDEPARRAMGRAGRARVRAEFGWNRVAAAVADGYRGLLRPAAGAGR